MSQYRQIKIEGKPVRCRALNPKKDNPRPGDGLVLGKEDRAFLTCFKGDGFDGHMPISDWFDGLTFYRPVPPRRKPKAAVKGPKAVKAWAIVKKDGTFTLQDVCSTRERAYFEVGAWNDHETCHGIQDARKRVVQVLITPLRPATWKGKGK